MLEHMTGLGEPRLEEVFTHIAANHDDYVSRLMEYLRQPTISAQNIGIREGAEKVAELARRAGLSTEIVETSVNPVVLARSPVRAGLPTVMFYGHYDVQPPEPLETWTTPPFEPSLRDGRIFARGAGDNKGQHFAQLMAIEAMNTTHGELPCNVIFMLDGEEEIGSRSLPQFVIEHRDKLQADLVITADGSMPSSGNPIVQFGVRGLATFEIRIRGANRDLHSGNYGNLAPNPLWEMVHLLASMKTPDGEITIDGLHDRIVPPSATEREAAARLPIDEEQVKAELGLTRFDAPEGIPYFDRLMFRPTLTINGIRGGYGGEGVKTVLPNEAVAKCDIRLVEAQRPEEILDLVEDHIRQRVPHAEFIRLQSMEPSKTPMDSPFTPLIQSAISVAHGVEPLLYPCVGGSLPDYVFTKRLGLPIFLIPYANSDQANHAPNENIKVDYVMRGIRTGAALLDRIGSWRRPA